MDNKEFKALGNYKKALYDLICYDSDYSEPFIDILMPTLDEDILSKTDNFLGGEYTINNDGDKKTITLNGRIFDVPFIYTYIENANNALCIETNISRCSSSTKEMTVTFYVVCHKKNLKLSNEEKVEYKKLGFYGNRIDVAVGLLGAIVNHSKEFGIGELKPTSFDPTKSYFQNTEYYGKIVEFTVTDFMTDYKEKSKRECGA